MRDQRIKKTSLLRSVLLGATMLINSSVHAEGEGKADARSLKHPLIGYWESKVPENGCLETYWFKEDGTAIFTSGDEQLEARYEVTPQPDAHGFFKLNHRVTLSNKALDCTKQHSEINTEQTSFVLFKPDGSSFISCDNDDPALESCFGPIELKNNAAKSLR